MDQEEIDKLIEASRRGQFIQKARYSLLKQGWIEGRVGRSIAAEASQYGHGMRVGSARRLHSALMLRPWQSLRADRTNDRYVLTNWLSEKYGVLAVRIICWFRWNFLDK